MQVSLKIVCMQSRVLFKKIFCMGKLWPSVMVLVVQMIVMGKIVSVSRAIPPSMCQLYVDIYFAFMRRARAPSPPPPHSRHFIPSAAHFIFNICNPHNDRQYFCGGHLAFYVRYLIFRLFVGEANTD